MNAMMNINVNKSNTSSPTTTSNINTNKKTEKTLLGAFLLSVLACTAAMSIMVVGCTNTQEDDNTDSDDQAVSELAGDDDNFDVLDRMGRPEMTNVTIGPGLMRLKLASVAFEKAKAVNPTSDETKALGAILARLAGELKLGSATFKREVEADRAAVAAGTTPPSNVSTYIRAYNRQSTFHPLAEEREDAMKLLSAGIRTLDTVKINGVEDAEDWDPAQVKKMAEILSEDALIVDIKGTCTQSSRSFMAFEREEFDGTPANGSCGGRVINDDIVDEVLTMWVKKSFDFSDGHPKRVSDNVSAVTTATAIPFGGGTLTLSPVIATFPYLGVSRATPLYVLPRTPASGSSSGGSSSSSDAGAAGVDASP